MMSACALLFAVTAGALASKPPPPPPGPPGPQPIVPPITPPACAAGDTPVKVFVMMGQSNMLGEGKKTGPGNSLDNAVQNMSMYPYLWDKATGNWSVSKNVRNVFVMGSGGVDSPITVFNNEFMTGAIEMPVAPPGMNPRPHTSIGPELGIGGALENATSGPIMMLKSCTGNRALGWDLMPPGTPRTTFTNSKNVTSNYCGYHDYAQEWPVNGTPPTNGGWYAGLQYDGDTQRAAYALGNLTTFYPGAKCYEVAGFFWWQGDRDTYDAGLSHHYEANLVRLIKQLRIQYSAPNAKFVTASLGQTKQGDTSNGGLILDAMEAVANATKYPEFAGNVAAVYTHPLEHTPGASNAHYGGDALTYMNIGQGMGQAMAKLLQADQN